MSTHLPWITEELQNLQQRGLLRRRRCVTPLADGCCEIDGRRLWNFASNDYLNLAHDRRLIEAATAALSAVGVGAGASALVTGRTEWHVRLEERLAQFERQDAALLFPTGYAANVGTIAALAGPGDVVFCDRLNHASLVDGCRLSGARFRVYRHDDLETLERELKKEAEKVAGTLRVPYPAGITDFESLAGAACGPRSPAESPLDCSEPQDMPMALVDIPGPQAAPAKQAADGTRSVPGTLGRRFIVTDSLFSMDGDVAPLDELCTLAARYDAAVFIDEAHATGVFGERGRGVAEMLNVEQRVAVRVGTLSKAVGCLGGFVTGSRELIDWLWNQARPQMFSTALPPAVCAAAAKAIEIIQEEPWRREHLLARSRQLHRRLVELELPVAANAVGPIVPLILKDPDAAVAAAARLEELGFVVAAIRPPTVPQGTSRLRITVSCAHTEETIDRLAEALAQTLGAN